MHAATAVHLSDGVELHRPSMPASLVANATGDDEYTCEQQHVFGGLRDGRDEHLLSEQGVAGRGRVDAVPEERGRRIASRYRAARVGNVGQAERAWVRDERGDR